MGALGLGKGLSVEHDYGKDIDTLYRREEMRAQASVEKERKAQFYGEMLKKGHVKGDYNNKRLEEHYKGLNNQLADFVTDNPGWETDPGLFAKFTDLTDQYLNNDIIREDQQVADQFKTLQAATQNGTMAESEIMAEMDKYNDYVNNGSGDPYVFVNPKKFDFGDMMKEASGNIGHTDTYVKAKTAEGFAGTKRVQKAKESSIQNEVNRIFSNVDMRKEAEKAYELAGGKAVAETAQQYSANVIRGQQNYTETEATMSEYQKIMLQKASEGDPTRSLVYDHIYSPYANAIASGEDIGPTDLQPQQSNATLTSWGKVGGQIQVQPADGYRIQTEDGIVDFRYSALVKLTGAGSFMTDSFNPYIQSTVEIRIPRATVDSANPVDTQMLKLLNDGGFEKVEFEAGGLNVLIDGVPPDEIIYRGTIMAPAVLNEITYNDFDNDTYGEKTMQGIQGSGQYKQMQTLRSIKDEANAAYKASGRQFEIKGNMVVEVDGKYWIDLNGDIREL